MRKILVFLILLLPCVTKSQMLEVSGIQEGVWDCDTILVVDDVVIPEGSELTIAPETKVVFDGYHNISVKGSFEAIGTEEAPIFFTSIDTTGFYRWDSGKGGWNGIDFHDVKTPVRIEYCDFSYGKAVKDNRYGGALRFFNVDDVEISNCTFSYNFTSGKGAALYAENSGFKIKECEINDNLGYNLDGEYMHGCGFQFLKCDVVMEDMYFHDNYCTACYGGGVNFDSCNVNVNKAVFEDNYAVNAAGMGIQRSNDYEIKVSNVLFYNNIAVHYGGAMAMATSSPLIQNVTMTNNYTVSAGGGAMQFFSEAHPVFKNCIIWGNDWYEEPAAITDASQIFIWGGNCRPEFYNSILEGGYEEVHGYENIAFYDETTMIENDPLFVDAENKNFHLSAESPAINTGTLDTAGLMLPSTDLAGNQRVIDGRIDMGCYEYNATSLQELKSHKNINIYPNPLNENSVCVFELKNASNVDVKVYDQNGKLIFINNYGILPSGKNEIPLENLMEINLKNNNIYFLSVESQYEILNTKFVY